jgi:hypothetical protein
MTFPDTIESDGQDETWTTEIAQKTLLYTLFLKAFSEFQMSFWTSLNRNTPAHSIDLLIWEMRKLSEWYERHLLAQCVHCSSLYIKRKSDTNGCVFCSAQHEFPSKYIPAWFSRLKNPNPQKWEKTESVALISREALRKNILSLLDDSLNWWEYEAKSVWLYRANRVLPLPTTKIGVARILWVSPLELTSPHAAASVLRNIEF